MCAQRSKSSFGLKLLIVVAAIAAGAFYFRNSFRPVARVAVVGPGLAVNAVNGSLLVVPVRPGVLTSEVGGRILKSELDPGKIVKEGEVLAQIDTGDIDLEIEKIQIDLSALEKKVEAGSAIIFEYDTALENQQNAERQHARGSLSDQDLARVRRSTESVKWRLDQEMIYNKQQIDTLKNALAVKERLRSKMTIMALFDGVITSVSARKGDQVANNQIMANMITLTRNVEAKISEENFASVEIGQRAVARFLTYGDERFDATVVRKMPTAEAQTQRYIAHLEVKIAPERLLPDLTGDVTIFIDERKTDTQIPRRALFGSFVYVVKDGVVELRKVQPGYTAVNLAEIREGLKKGEHVIIDELDKFKAGDRVQIEVVK